MPRPKERLNVMVRRAERELARVKEPSLFPPSARDLAHFKIRNLLLKRLREGRMTKFNEGLLEKHFSKGEIQTLKAVFEKNAQKIAEKKQAEEKRFRAEQAKAATALSLSGAGIIMPEPKPKPVRTASSSKKQLSPDERAAIARQQELSRLVSRPNITRVFQEFVMSRGSPVSWTSSFGKSMLARESKSLQRQVKQDAGVRSRFVKFLESMKWTPENIDYFLKHI